MKRDDRSTTAADSAGLAGGGITETAVRKATGKGWGDWYDLLDAAGAREMTHQQIVSVVARQQAGDWWQRMITVAYEQARGIRGTQQKDQGFSATASKSIQAGVTRVFPAWTDPGLRADWINGSKWAVRKSVLYKTLRIALENGRRLDVYFWPRGEGRTLVQIEHCGLASPEDVQPTKVFWNAALERLRELLEDSSITPLAPATDEAAPKSGPGSR